MFLLQLKGANVPILKQKKNLRTTEGEKSISQRCRRNQMLGWITLCREAQSQSKGVSAQAAQCYTTKKQKMAETAFWQNLAF